MIISLFPKFIKNLSDANDEIYIILFLEAMILENFFTKIWVYFDQYGIVVIFYYFNLKKTYLLSLKIKKLETGYH